MRKSLVILLIVEFVLAVAMGQMGTMHRSEFDRAFMAWHQHPTVDARAALDREKRSTELMRWGFTGVTFAMLAGATLLVGWLRKDERARAANAVEPICSKPK